MERAHKVLETNYNRRDAAKQQLAAIRAIDEQTPQMLYIELDAQRRLADAEANYYRSLVEYELAIKNVHFEKGSILEYNGVFLSELPSPAKAYQDAYEKIKMRTRAGRWTSGGATTRVVSEGLVPQGFVPGSTPASEPKSTPKKAPASPAAPTAPVEEVPVAPPEPKPQARKAQPKAAEIQQTAESDEPAEPAAEDAKAERPEPEPDDAETMAESSEDSDMNAQADGEESDEPPAITTDRLGSADEEEDQEVPPSVGES
jgi:hypothetical protein